MLRKLHSNRAWFLWHWVPSWELPELELLCSSPFVFLIASDTDHYAVPSLWYCQCPCKALLMRQHVSVMANKWYTDSFPVCKFSMSKMDWVISERPEYAVFVQILFSLNCIEFVFLSSLSSFLKKLNLGISSLLYLLSPKDVNCGLVFALHISHAVLYTVVFTDAF